LRGDDQLSIALLHFFLLSFLISYTSVATTPIPRLSSRFVTGDRSDQFFNEANMIISVGGIQNSTGISKLIADHSLAWSWMRGLGIGIIDWLKQPRTVASAFAT
jgi:hypothetical protein